VEAIRFSYMLSCAGREHYVGEHDVLVVLSRLPETFWARLRAVHFKNCALGEAETSSPGFGSGAHLHQECV
jgi:hypothetical protein